MYCTAFVKAAFMSFMSVVVFVLSSQWMNVPSRVLLKLAAVPKMWVGPRHQIRCMVYVLHDKKVAV